MNDNKKTIKPESTDINKALREEIEFLRSENDMLMKQNQMFFERNKNLIGRIEALRLNNDSLININTGIRTDNSGDMNINDNMIGIKEPKPVDIESGLPVLNREQLINDNIIENNVVLMDPEEHLTYQDDILINNRIMRIEKKDSGLIKNDKIIGIKTDADIIKDSNTVKKENNEFNNDNIPAEECDKETIKDNMNAAIIVDYPNNGNMKINNDSMKIVNQDETYISKDMTEKKRIVKANIENTALHKNNVRQDYDNITLINDSIKAENDIGAAAKSIRKEIKENMTATLRKKYAGKMMSRWTEELLYFMNNKKVKSEMLKSAMGISTATLMRDINLFRRKGWIVFNGVRKNGYYSITQKGIEFVNKGES